MKTVIFLYIHDEFSEREIKKTVPLTTALKKIKCLGINLSKEMETLYSENSKTLIKKYKRMQVNGNVYHAYTLEDLILIRVYCTNQGSLLLQLNSIKILMHFSGSRIDNPKICMKYRRS